MSWNDDLQEMLDDCHTELTEVTLTIDVGAVGTFDDATGVTTRPPELASVTAIRGERRTISGSGGKPDVEEIAYEIRNSQVSAIPRRAEVTDGTQVLYVWACEHSVSDLAVRIWCRSTMPTQ